MVRTKVACNLCRKKKKKCERLSTGYNCKRCDKSGHQCVYSPPKPKGRKPRKLIFDSFDSSIFVTCIHTINWIYLIKTRNADNNVKFEHEIPNPFEFTGSNPLKNLTPSLSLMNGQPQGFQGFQGFLRDDSIYTSPSINSSPRHLHANGLLKGLSNDSSSSINGSPQDFPYYNSPHPFIPQNFF